MEAKGGSEKQACDFCFVLNRPADDTEKLLLKDSKVLFTKLPMELFNDEQYSAGYTRKLTCFVKPWSLLHVH